jgi:hypothetical protein
MRKMRTVCSHTLWGLGSLYSSFSATPIFRHEKSTPTAFRNRGGEDSLAPTCKAPFRIC